jgi:hypothetical protein
MEKSGSGMNIPDPRHCRGLKTPIIHFNWTRIVHRHRIHADPDSDPNFMLMPIQILRIRIGIKMMLILPKVSHM